MLNYAQHRLHMTGVEQCRFLDRVFPSIGILNYLQPLHEVFTSVYHKCPNKNKDLEPRKYRTIAADRSTDKRHVKRMRRPPVARRSFTLSHIPPPGSIGCLAILKPEVPMVNAARTYLSKGLQLHSDATPPMPRKLPISLCSPIMPLDQTC